MIFVDSSFLVAMRWTEDAHRDEAERLSEVSEGERVVTTNHVRGETWTVLQRRAGHGAAVEFLDDLERSDLQVIEVDGETEFAALHWLRRNPDREYSFVDATSFAVMRVNGIERALTFDEDFEAAGFELLRA